ncbi:uncharacterized protein [Arachis hypogaea]|uniref:uncharacterized protein n=1 Tax=Arachis hypogaea TaxID=3818 RepID=UPI003B21305D
MIKKEKGEGKGTAPAGLGAAVAVESLRERERSRLEGREKPPRVLLSPPPSPSSRIAIVTVAEAVNRRCKPRESQWRREPLLRHRRASINAEPPCRRCCWVDTTATVQAVIIAEHTHMAEEERISAAARVVGGSCAAIRITVLPPLKLVEEGAIVRRSYCCSCSCSILLPCFWFSQLPESLPPWVLSLELLGANDGAARKPYCCCFIISFCCY